MNLNGMVPETPKERIDRLFPKCAATTYELTSPLDVTYNCIALAAGDFTRFWSDERGYYWPPAVNRGPTLHDLKAMFEHLGYTSCGLDMGLEPGIEKVALFAEGGNWTHASKQCEDGRWWSKAGIFEDIKHDLRDVECPLYGDVALVMHRLRAN